MLQTCGCVAVRHPCFCTARSLRGCNAAAATQHKTAMRLCILLAPVAGLRFARRVRFWKGPKKAPIITSAPAAAGSEAASHGRSATPLELERIQTARSRIDDAWVAQRSDRELLPFARACSTADQLATRLRDTAEWRREWARTNEDWSFDTFFTERRDAFYRDRRTRDGEKRDSV